MESKLPFAELCPTCTAVIGNATTHGDPLGEDVVTLFMTVRDETGRRAVIRHEVPKEIWLDLDPSKAGTVIVADLRAAHATLKRQAQREAERRQVQVDE